MRARFAFAAMLLLAGGCQSEEPLTLPAVQRPLGYDTVTITLPGCRVALPPVRSDNPICPVEAIGTSIDRGQLCEMVAALREWVQSVPLEPTLVQPGDWERVRAVTVCRLGPLTWPDGTVTWDTVVEADVPERPRPFYVASRSNRPELRFGVNHR